MELFRKIETSANFIKLQTKIVPKIGIILGTGLGELVDFITNKTTIEYFKIPFFPCSTAPSHRGLLHIGEYEDKTVCVMQGRVHYYEGYSLQEVTYPVRVMKALGCEILMIMSAVGSVNPSMRAGDLVLIADHINLFGDNPLIGPNDTRLGVRFPDMSEPYSHELMDKAQKVALECGIALKRGVYLGWSGPSLETASEYRMISRLGADMVGMSTVPEVIVANHGKLKTLGIATISNCCNYCDLKPCSIEDIIATSMSANERLKRLIPALIKAL